MRTKKKLETERVGRLRWLVAVAGAGMAMWLGAGLASAQLSCDPSTTPCQTCPAPPPCTPSSTACSELPGVITDTGGSTNQTLTTSFQTCTGTFTQETIILENTIGPGDICVGPDRSVGCVVLAGTTNLHLHTDTILGVGTVAVPTLSLWALGALAVALGALALRRLAGAPPS